MPNVIQASRAVYPQAAVGAASSFTPTDVTGLVIWLDTNPISGLNQNNDCVTTAVSADGDPVGCVTDQSANGYNVTQATSTDKPTYKTNIINTTEDVFRCDGNDFLTNATAGGDLTGNFTIFSVSQGTSKAGYHTIAAWGDSTGDGEKRALHARITTGNAALGYTGGAVVSSYDIQDGNPHYCVVTWDGTTIRIRVDGAERTTGTPTLNAFTSTEFSFCKDVATSYFIGDILLSGVYDSELTGDDLTNLETWLAGRAGL